MPGFVRSLGSLSCLLIAAAGSVRAESDVADPATSALSFPGVVRSSLVTQIASPLSTTIRWVVPEGTAVKKGDLLITLDDSQLNDQLLQQQVTAKVAANALAQAEFQLESIVNEQALDVQVAEQAISVAQLAKDQVLGEGGQHQQEITQAEGRIEEAKLMRRLAERRLARLQDRATESDDELIEAQLAAVQAETKLQLAMQQLTYLNGVEAAHLEATLDLDVLKGKIDRIKIMRQQISAKQQLEKLVLSQKRSLDNVTKQIRQLEDYVAKCQIFAPFDGVVQSLAAPIPGAGERPMVGVPVNSGQSILQLVKTDKLEVEFLISENDVAKVRLRQPATIRIDALRLLSVKGQVDRIFRRADAAQLPHELPYVGRVSIDAPQPALRVGMSAIVDIEVSE